MGLLNNQSSQQHFKTCTSTYLQVIISLIKKDFEYSATIYIWKRFI